MIHFSERQERTIATALTMSSGLLVGAVVLVGFWLVLRFFSAFAHVFLPLAVAGVLALVVEPYYTWLLRQFGSRRVLSLIVLYLTVLIPVGIFFWFFGALMVEQLSGLLQQLPKWASAAWQSCQERWPQIAGVWNQYEVPQKLSGFLESHGSNLAAGLQKIGGSAWSAGLSVFKSITGLLGWVVLPVYLTFMILARPQKKDDYRHFLPFMKPETQDDVLYLGHEFVVILVSFFRGQLMVALMQGLLFATGFALVGLQYGFVLGLLLGFLNIIPYLASIIGLGIALPLAYFQVGGGHMTLIWVISVFIVVQCIEGYILTPKIMGDRTGLHPMAIMVAIFFWGSALNGIAGMMLAIPITAFLVVLWRLAQEKYIEGIV